MEGFAVLIYISLGVTIVFLITSMLLKRYKYDKYIIRMFVGMLLVSIGILVISLVVGGWVGMGYGIIGLCFFIGTIIGGLILYVINFFRKKLNKKGY